MRQLDMRPNDTQGKLITFCGLDGCGKTTMLRMLNEKLRGKYNVFLTKQPTDFVRNTDIFRTYMDCPDHSEYDYRSLSLLAAGDRIQHTNRTIYPHLKQGDIVLSDRYIYSCLANLIARGYGKDKWIYEIAESIVMPDIAFFLDVPVETAVARVRSRPSEQYRYIDMELQYKLRKLYKAICNINKGILISTERSIEAAAGQMFAAAEKLLEV